MKHICKMVPDVLPSLTNKPFNHDTIFHIGKRIVRRQNLCLWNAFDIHGTLA